MKKIVLVVNKSCQNYRKNKSEIDDFISKTNCNNHLVEGKDLAETFANSSDYDIVVAAGGDGTIHTAVQYIKPGQLLAVLPVGTLNHFLKDARLPDTIDSLVDAINNDKSKLIDVISLNGEKVINNISIGFYPKFVRKRDALENAISKMMAYLPAFLRQLKSQEPLELKLNYENQELKLSTHSLLISNNAYNFNPVSSYQRDTLQNAELGVYHLNSLKHKLANFDNQLWDTHITRDNIVITIANENELEVAVDGELKKVKCPLEIEMLPKNLGLVG